MKKRAIFIVLALVLAMALLPVPASAAGGVEINSKNFPDSSFRHYVWLEFDNDCDFYLSASEIAAAKYIYVEDYGITTLKGIEHFSALEDLYCQGNKLTKLDISQNKKLKFLFCFDNNIKKLDISNNKYLIKTYRKGLKTKYSSTILYEYSTHPEWEGGYADSRLWIDKTTKIVTESSPKIVTQPTSVSAKAGNTVTFKVKATGSSLKYQWFVQKPRKNWTEVKNGTGAALKVKATKKMNGWKYRCKVYNAKGYVFSKTVTLKVKK